MNLPRAQFTVLTSMLVTLLAAFLARLYVRQVKQAVTYIESGNPPFIHLDVVVLDAATGQPIRGAKVDLLFLHPAWRGRREMRVGDLRKKHGPPDWQPSPFMTDGGGNAHTAVKAQKIRRIEHHAHGLCQKVIRLDYQREFTIEPLRPRTCTCLIADPRYEGRWPASWSSPLAWRL